MINNEQESSSSQVVKLGQFLTVFILFDSQMFEVFCFSLFPLLRLNGAPGEVFKPNSTAHDIGRTESLVRKNTSANSLKRAQDSFFGFSLLAGLRKDHALSD